MEIERVNSDLSLASVSNTSNEGSFLFEIEKNILHQKRKRRSKNDQDGRLYKCQCGRAYLSELALKNHQKSKHSNQFSSEITLEDCKKKRGRPKKTSELKLINYAEVHYKIFFQKDIRKRINSNEEIIIKNYCEKVFNDIYICYGEKCTLKINSISEHPLISNIYRGVTKSSKNSNTCDEILFSYLEEVSFLTNSEYFLFVFKFIILFRECINKYKNIELENSVQILSDIVPSHVKEFTQYYDAEQAPEICNEFLTEFLNSSDFFGLVSSYPNEFVEIMQHFCFWLYINNHTSSRLSLVGTCV